MNIRYIKYFVAVAENEGFTRAANALYISQPALSQQIKLLEESLGTQLFDRSGRNVRLTDAGEVYLQYVRSAFQKLEEGTRAIHDVENLSRGSLRIAFTPTFTNYLIGPLIAEFYNRYPKINIQVQETSQEKIEKLLLNNDLDIGVAFDDVQSPEIQTMPLLKENLGLVMVRHHPLVQQKTLTLNDLNHEKLILLSEKFATRKQINYYFQENGLQPSIQIEANSISAILEIIRRTSLITILPAEISNQSHDLHSIPLIPKEIQRTAVLIHRKGGRLSAATRAFIKIAEELFKEKSRE